MKTAVMAVAFAAASMSAGAFGATVHGTIVQRAIRDIRPVGNMLLTLKSPTGARSARIYTDRAGEFYFYNVPRGKYELEIWRNGMDDNSARTLETCRIEIVGPDVQLPKLRLHSSPLRVPPQVRNCTEGLEHLYTSG
jgi:hypothetical protein